jgi:hypothetical protein
MSDLINQIRYEQIIAGEMAVSLSEESQEFFMMFVQVRKELCDASNTDSYHLEEAMRITFDRWTSKLKC